MEDFVSTFGKKMHVFLPVIHLETDLQAIRNTEIAIDGGADGIFLINHSTPVTHLLDCYQKVRECFPDLWIGLNPLEHGMNALNYLPADANGWWVDNSAITDHGVSKKAEAFDKLRRNNPWKGLYFGGVAFKGQQHVEDVALAAKNAVPYVDVITTSGDRTGEAPSLVKIQTMRRETKGHPFVIASGMNADNVESFMPYCDGFLVSTGISDSFAQFDSGETSAFGKKLGK